MSNFGENPSAADMDGGVWLNMDRAKRLRKASDEHRVKVLELALEMGALEKLDKHGRVVGFLNIFSSTSSEKLKNHLNNRVSHRSNGLKIKARLKQKLEDRLNARVAAGGGAADATAGTNSILSAEANSDARAGCPTAGHPVDVAFWESLQ